MSSKEINLSDTPVPILSVHPVSLATRFGIKTWRNYVKISDSPKEYVVKLQTKIFRSTTYEDVRREKASFEQAVDDLPEQSTLFVYGMDHKGKPAIIRIQKRLSRTINDVPDSELTQAHIREQLINIIDNTNSFLAEHHWQPDIFGFPSKAHFWNWGDLRKSTNLMDDGNNKLLFIDLNTPTTIRTPNNLIGKFLIVYCQWRLSMLRKKLVEARSKD